MEKPKKIIKNGSGLLILLTLFSIVLISGVSLWSYDFYKDLQARQSEIQTKIDRTLEENMNAEKVEVEKKVIVREVPLQTNDTEKLEETVSNLTNQYNRITKETADSILNQFSTNEQLVQEMITNIQKQIDQIKGEGANQEEVSKLEKLLEDLKNSLKELEKEGEKDQNSLKGKIENLVELLEKYQEELEKLKEEIETIKNKAEVVNKETETINKEVETINKDVETINKEVETIKNEIDTINKTQESLLQLINESQTKIEQILADFSGLSGRLEEVEKKVLECFQSVSDGKKILAAAITDKGIETAATDEFSIMAKNVRGLITMSSNPNVLFDINSWTAPEDCIAVMSFSVTMECNSDYKQTSTVTLSGVREWKFEWGPMSSSDTGWHTRGTSGNCTFEAKKGQTYTLSFDPGTSDYLVYGWGPRTWIVPSPKGYSVMPLLEESEDDFYQKVLEAEKSSDYYKLLENKRQETNKENRQEQESKENESKEQETKENESKEQETKENESKERETKENETKENESKEQVSKEQQSQEIKKEPIKNMEEETKETNNITG